LARQSGSQALAGAAHVEMRQMYPVMVLMVGK
jgi:hypothetical protein